MRPATPPLLLTIPGRFHPGYSVLGRVLRRTVGDARRAEALFIVVLTALALGLLLAHYVAWALLEATIRADPRSPTAVAFWIGQVGSLLLYAGVALVGFAPRITVTYDETGLHLRQGQRERFVSHDAIEGAETTSARLFHRHYRRYAATEVFVGRLEREVLLLRTARGPIILGLSATDRARLCAALDAQIQPAFASSAA